MPKLCCPCGHVHDLSPIPDAGWITVLDTRYDEMLAAEAERERLQKEAAPSEAFGAADACVVDLHGRMFECPVCGRVMWRRAGEEAFLVYIRESVASNAQPERPLPVPGRALPNSLGWRGVVVP